MAQTQEEKKLRFRTTHPFLHEILQYLYLSFIKNIPVKDDVNKYLGL